MGIATGNEFPWLVNWLDCAGGACPASSSSGRTRSDLGRRCRDTFLSLQKTCRKLGLSFWQLWKDRLTGAATIPPLYKRFRLAYAPQYWGVVFPLGMYKVCMYRLAHAIELPFLKFPQAFIDIALAAR